jgi:hypothetical protein
MVQADTPKFTSIWGCTLKLSRLADDVVMRIE